MKKTFVRLISAVLSAAMTLTAVPLSAFAEGETHTHDGDSNVITAPLDFREKKADESSNGWSWDYDTKTLTLDGVNIQVTLPDSDGDIHSVVTVPDGTEIVLKGENTIIQTGSVEYTSYALGAVNTDTTNCDGTMTISGDGVLNAENRSTDSMTRSLGGTIILNGGTVNATGKVVAESLEIHNDGALNANATTASFDGAAVGVGGSITVDGNGKLTAIGCAIENENIMNSAIWLNGNQDSKISVTGNGSITVPESNGARYGICYNVDRRRINAEISGGNVTAYGTLCGISGINLIMNGTGSVYATGGVLSIDNTDPKIDENEFVIKGSTEYKASESTVTDDAEYVNSWYCIGEENAKTVVIKPDTSPRIILGKQTGIFKTEEYKIIEDIDMTDIKLKGTVYFDITLKNMSDEEFADARGYFGGDEPDLSASIIKTDYGWVCMVCDTKFSTTYDTDNTLTIKCGDIVSNTVQVKSNANRFNKVTQGDNTNRTVFYTNTSQEEKDNYKLVSTYTVDSESISYNWYSTNSAYSADELGAAVSGTGGEFKLADNIPAGNYVLYCDITYSDGDSTETVTEKFTFTYKECAHENGYSDGKCTDCGALCDHSNIDIDTGKCNECERQFVATISTDGSAPIGYDTLKDCLNSITADTENYVKIYQDIEEDSSQEYIVKYRVTLDLNGHRLDDELKINEKNSTDNNGELTLTGTGYINNVYAYSNTTFTIDNNANIEADTFFNNAGTRFTVSDGANVTVRYLAVKESLSNEGNATSVKLATGMKITEMLAYDLDKSSPLSENIMLKNLLSDNQMLKYESSSKIIDLYYGATRIIINSKTYGYGTITVVEHTDADHTYSDGTGKCKECGKPCEHSGDINTDTGICSICGAVVSVAIYTDANGISKYVDADELHSLLNEYNGSGTVKLFKDYDNPNAKYDLYGELTIDVNGHELNIRSITPCKNGKLTIKNSGDQVIFGCNAYPTNDPSYAGGTLIIDGDIILDTAIYVYDSSTVILKDGTYHAGLYARDSKTLYDMLGEGKAFFKADGTLFNASVKEISSDVTLIVKDHSHTYVDGKCDCGYVCPHSDVDIDTGKCTECEYQYAAVIVKDGTAASVYKETEMEAAFEAADSGVNTGCTLRVYKNYTGSYKTLSGKFTLWIAEKANGGTLTVSGDITVTGSKKNNSFYGDFDVEDGGKLTFDENCGAMGTVLVGAGTFDCYYSLGTTLNINDASSDVILHGGYFIKIRYNGGGDRANAEILTLLAENRMFMTRSNDPIDGSKTLLKDGFATTVIVIRHEDHGYDSTTGKCTICGKRCGHTDVDSKTGMCKTCQYEFVATLTVGDKVTGFDSLSDCLSKTSEDSENYVKIYKNIDDRTTINVNHTVTVDLNGHKLYYIELKVNNDNGAGNLTLTGSEDSYISQVDVCGGRTFKIDSDANINFETIFVEAGARFEVSYGANVTVNTLVVKESLKLYGSTTTSVRLTTGMRIGTLMYELDRNSGSGNLLFYSLLGEGKALQYDNSGEYVDIYEKFTSKTIHDSFTVVDHYEHSYDKATGKCVCGYVCPHSDVDSKTGVCPTCKYQLTAGISGVGTAKYFDNIDNAFTAALSAENSGCTLTLYKDCELSQNIVIGNATVTLDVNGHSILLAYRIKVNDGGVLYLKNSGENGSIETEIDVNKGGTLINGTADDSRSAVSVFGVTADAAKRVEIYGGSYEGLTVNNGTSGIALYGGSYESINTNDLTDSTPVSALLAKGYAFATLNSVTHLPESIVDGSAVTLSEGIRNVMVVAHTHTYTETNAKCACGAVLYAKVTSADGTSNKYFDSIEEGLLYADKAENKGCVFTLVARGLLKDKVTLSSGQFTIATATTDNTYVIGPYEGEITIDGADVIAEGDLAFRCNVNVKSGSLTLPEGSGTGFDSIIISGGTVTISEGVNADNNAGADNLSVDKDATDVKLTIGGGTYGNVYFGQLKLKDVLASGVRVISYDNPSDPTAEKTATALLYSDIAEESSLNSNNGTVSYYLVTKCEHKNEDGSYAFNDSGICKYCNSEFAASVSYTDGGEKTELFGDICDAFDKANAAGTATITLYKDIADSEIAHEINVTGNVTLALNGKTLGATDKANKICICGSTLTVNGNGKVWSAIEAKPDSKLTITNGEYYDVSALSDSEVVILDGVIDCLSVYGTGKAEVSGGKFKYLFMYNGKAIESVLADGYAYKNADGTWLSIDEREKDSYLGGSKGALSVEEAPIKSASIAWVGGEAPVIYRNGEKYLYVNITYELAVGSRGATYSDYVNGNNRIKDYNLYNKYMVHCYEIGKLAAKDGEVEYYIVLKCNGYEYKSNVLKLTLATCSHPEDSLLYENDGFVICGICDALIEAEVVDADGKSLGYADIESAIKLAQENEGSTVKLISEGISESITVTGGRFTVDFNGKKVFYQFDVNGGDVTFTSSVKQADVETLISGIEVNGADAKVIIDGKIKLGSVTLTSGALAVNSTDGYIKELSINGGNAVIDDAIIGALKANGGDTVINCVEADSLSMNFNGSGSLSIVTGTFGSTTCERDSGYTLGMAIASGSAVSADSMNGITVYTYEAIQTMTSTYRIFVDKCSHKDGKGNYVLDGNPCPYCNEEIVATVSYTAGGSEETELFSDIYDAFAKANDVGTATITLYKDIENDITDTIAVTGNVTVELNDKKLSTPGFDPFYAIEVKSGKLTVNGSGTIKRAVVRNGGDAEINGGTFSDFRIEDGGNAVINGGKFNSIKVSGEGRNVGQLLADGYAYKNFEGFWSTVAEREKQGIASVNVLEAPIKSASIAWADEGTPVVYRNGVKYLDVNVTYDVADTSKQITYSDFVNGNNRIKDSELSGNWYAVFGYEIGDIITKDGEVEYYTVLKCDGYEYKSNVLKLTLATCSHPEDRFTEKDSNGWVYCSICDLRIDAQVIAADGEMLGYADIESAIELAQENEGSTVKLISERVPVSVTVTGGKFTVDFNGKKVYYNFDVNGGDVTFTSSTEQADADYQPSGIKVNGTNAKVTIDGKIKLGRVRIISGTLTVNSTDGYIGELSTEGGKTDIDGARIGALKTFGGEAVIKNVSAGSLAMCDNRSGGSKYNISIVSGRFGSFTCENGSNYTLGRAIASGSRVIGSNANGGIVYKYADIQNMTEADDITVIKCDHKDGNYNYELDGKPCPYCNEEIVATVSYTADGSEQTDLFSDIYDAFAKANDVGTATITLYKDIADSELTRDVNVTGNVTLALNGKKLGDSYDGKYIQSSDGGELTVNGDGKIAKTVRAKKNSKLTINSGEFDWVIIDEGGDAVISGGSIAAVNINGNAELSGGKFYIIAVYGTLESMLADGYAYKIDGGAWLSIADRARSGYSNVDHEHKPVTVEEAPIKSATITAEDESPIIYRNGYNSVDYTANVTYMGNETLYVTRCLIDGTVIREKTIFNGYCELCSGEVDKAVAEDGEIQYYCIFTYDGYDYKSNAVTLTVATCRHPGESVKCDDNGNYVCGICNITLTASVELSDGTLSYYGNRNDAIGAAEDSEGCTLKLLSYSFLIFSETFDISKGRFTVDFNKDDGSGLFTFNVKGGDITFTTSQATSNPLAGVTVSGENANVLIDSKARLNSLVVNSGKVTVDGANIGAITINGGDTVFNYVKADLLSINKGTTDGSGYNVSIVSGTFNNFTCENESNYTLGKAIASGSRVTGFDVNVGLYKYADIQKKTEIANIIVEKCNHKDANDSYVLDGKPCPYCNEEIVATVSYTADGSEQTDLFSDIYDAFAKANEVGTATVTLYKDIENSEFTRYITVTGNVTLALNGKKLGYSFVSLTVEVSDGGMLTVDGDGKMMVPIIVNENAKLTVNGGEIATVMIYKDGDAVIGGGFIEDLDVNGNVKLSGGKFDNIEIANGSLESILADGYAYKKDGGAWLSIAERAKEKYYSWNNEDKPVTVEEAPIKSATLSTKINKLYRNSNANPMLKFNLTIAHGPNLNDSDVRMRYGINSYECGDTGYYSLSALVKDAKLSADDILMRAGDSDAAKIYYVVTTGDGYEIKSNTVSIDLVDCDHSQVVDPTADKETAGNITEPTYCEICESKFNAKITKGDDVRYYDDLDDAAKDAQKSENEGCTLYPLYNKKGYVGQFVITEGNFTLKYAVRTAFANPVVIKGNAKLKVTGRCAVTSSENPDAFFVDGGDVTFDGLATGSNVTINGGNVTMSGNNINRLTINGGNVSISSGGFAEIVTTVSDKVIADYIDPGFWVQDRGTKEWIDIYSLDKATASSTNVLSVRLCPMQIIKPIDTVYYTNGYYPGNIPSLQINAEPWYSDEVNAKVAYQWIAIDENGNETEIEGATDRKLSLENLTTGRYYCRLTYSNAATAGVSMKSDVVTATITECEHSGGEATCTNKAKCEICGAEYGEMLPHSYAHIKAYEYLKSAATCTAKAVYYTSCTECGQSSKGTADEETFEYGNALGHKYGEWVSNGDGTHTRVCANDNKHTETKACHGGKATCTAKAICEVCGKAYGEMTAHTFTKTVSEKYLKSAATCTAKAVYYTSCTECGQSSKGTKDEATFEYGNALGHKYGEWVSNGDGTHTRVCANDNKHTETKACHGGKATCTAKAICEVCGKAYGEMTAHTFTKTVSEKYLKSAATCTAKAVYYTSCTECGQSSKGTKDEATFEYGNALGHKYGEWVSNGDGTHTRVCANDNKHTETKACHGGKATCTAKAICEDCGKAYGEMTAHTFTAKSAVSRYLKKAATCTEKSVYYVSCAGCGLSSKGTASEATFEGSALGHLLTQWNVTDASCTENGSEERHCTRCDYKQTHIIPAKGHTFGEWKITKNVGCVTDGEQTRECTICGSKETKVIAATGVHVYGEWKVTKAPTCTAAGVKVRTCTGCNAKETMTLQAIGHKYIASTVKPTYSAKGYTLYKCSLCGKSYKSNYTNMLVLPSVSGLKATSKTDKSITLGWNRNANAAGYVIEYYNGAKWVKKSTVTKNTTVKYTVSSLKPGTVNKFRIRAYNATNYSAYSYITVNTLPSAVSGFKTVSKTSSTSTLSWNKNTSADGYIIDRYIGNRWMQTLKVVGSGNVSATVKNLTAGSTNKLRIRAYKTINKKTEYSSYTYLNVKTKPAQMTGLKVKSKTNNTVTLQWNKNTTADSVFIEKYDGSKWVNVKKLSAGYTAYTVNGLSSGRTYRFRVRAYRAGEYSGYTYLNVNTRPYTTTGMKSKSVTKNSIVLQWNKNTSADGYSIEKYDGKKWVQVKRYTSNKSTTYTIKSLKAGTTYKFRMRAYKTIGNVNEYSAYTYCNVTTAK